MNADRGIIARREINALRRRQFDRSAASWRRSELFADIETFVPTYAMTQHAARARIEFIGGIVLDKRDGMGDH